MMRKSPWFVVQEGFPRAQLRLFCFHYAGGNAGVFRAWRAELDPRVELVSIQLPGRGQRFNEPLLHTVDQVVQAVLGEIVPYLDIPYALLGHSVGAMLAYEVACALQTHCTPAARELIVSGARAPQIPRREPPVSCASDAVLIERVRGYRSMPEETLESPELMELLLPMLRADFAVHESYTKPPHEPLHCPVTALGGKDDEWVTEQDLSAWGGTTRGGFEWHRFEGGHFFIDTSRPAVLGRLNGSLRKWLATQEH